MTTEYEITKFNITMKGKVSGYVEKKTSGLSSYWIAVLNLDDGTEYGSIGIGIGDSPQAALYDIFPRSRRKLTHMLRDLDRLEKMLPEPIFVELASA